jgi:retron-type reverse transcriptase
MKAYQYYPKIFSAENLKKIYEEKICLSLAVGRDGVKNGIFANKLENEINLILPKVDSQTYKFTSFKEKLISKGPAKAPRQISIPTVRDRLTLRALCDIISVVFDDCKAYPPHEYIKAIKELARKSGSNCSFLRIDIEGYYPSINHKILLRKIRKRIRKPQITSLIEKAIKTPTGKPNILKNKNIVGVPQGLSISNILSAIYLNHIDLKYKPRINYFRYVDDILIVCKTSEAQQIYKELCSDIKRTSRLKCHPLDSNNPGKTRIETISDGIDYLGFHITDKEVAVRPSSYKRMFTNLMKVFTQYKYLKKKKRFLWRLNLKITGCIFEEKRLGWMFFFSQTENTSQLKRLDIFVEGLIKKHRLQKEGVKVKTFIKAYHEIRYNSENTSYIPNFEKYSLEQKIEIISLLTDKTLAEISAWDVVLIEEQFRKCASKEVAQLEKDLLEVFS